MPLRTQRPLVGNPLPTNIIGGMGMPPYELPECRRRMGRAQRHPSNSLRNNMPQLMGFVPQPILQAGEENG